MFLTLIAAAVLLTACAGNDLSLSPPPGPEIAKAKPNEGVPAPIPGPTPTMDATALPLGSTTSAAVPRDPVMAGERVKIGLLLPLSSAGQTAIIAQSMQRAAELAIMDMRANNVDLIVKDDKGTPEGAMTAATEMVAAGVELVIGPLFSRSVSTASGVTRAHQIPMVAFSNDRSVAGTGVNLLSFFAGPEVERVVGFAVARGLKRFAAFIPDDTYGKQVEQHFREAVVRAGGSVVAAATYPADSAGRSAPVLQPLKQLALEIRNLESYGDPVDAILIPGGEDTASQIGPMLATAGIDPKRMRIIGTGALDVPNIGRNAAFVGAWFAAPDPRGYKDFAQRYARAHGHAPPRIASLAYDATAIAAVLSEAPKGARYIPSALTRRAGFTGIDGLFRLTAEGPVERALAVLEVTEFDTQVIEPPPAQLEINRVN